MKGNRVSKGSIVYILDLLVRGAIILVTASFVLYIAVIPESFAFFTYSTVSPPFTIEIKLPVQSKALSEKEAALDNKDVETGSQQEGLSSEELGETLEEGQLDVSTDTEVEAGYLTEIVDEEIVSEEVGGNEDTSNRQQLY